MKKSWLEEEAEKIITRKYYRDYLDRLCDLQTIFLGGLGHMIKIGSSREEIAQLYSDFEKGRQILKDAEPVGDTMVWK
jgi:hypothetical protein